MKGNALSLAVVFYIFVHPATANADAPKPGDPCPMTHTRLFSTTTDNTGVWEYQTVLGTRRLVCVEPFRFYF